MNGFGPRALGMFAQNSPAQQQNSPGLMQQLGTFGSPLNSALLNFGLETMNAGQQGQSVPASLFAGLGGGAGAYLQGRQMQDQAARQSSADQRERRLLQLQEMALRGGLGIGTGGGGLY